MQGRHDPRYQAESGGGLRMLGAVLIIAATLFISGSLGGLAPIRLNPPSSGLLGLGGPSGDPDVFPAVMLLVLAAVVLVGGIWAAWAVGSRRAIERRLRR